MMTVEDGNPGIAACQLHGRYDHLGNSWGASPLFYEGLVLRLRLDGSIVRKQISWVTERNFLQPGVKTWECIPSRHFSDTYHEAELRYLRDQSKKKGTGQ